MLKTLLQKLVVSPSQIGFERCAWIALGRSYCSSDEMAPPSPYRPPDKWRRYGYKQTLFTSGSLPRVEDKVRSLPRYNPSDPWGEKKAHFGQNDYIDILGDGTIQPIDLVTGPPHAIGYKGHEFRRLVRRLRVEGRYLREFFPDKHHRLNKRLYFLYKKVNRRRRPNYIMR